MASRSANINNKKLESAASERKKLVSSTTRQRSSTEGSNNSPSGRVMGRKVSFSDESPRPLAGELQKWNKGGDVCSAVLRLQPVVNQSVGVVPVESSPPRSGANQDSESISGSSLGEFSEHNFIPEICHTGLEANNNCDNYSEVSDESTSQAYFYSTLSEVTESYNKPQNRQEDVKESSHPNGQYIPPTGLRPDLDFIMRSKKVEDSEPKPEEPNTTELSNINVMLNGTLILIAVFVLGIPIVFSIAMLSPLLTLGIVLATDYVLLRVISQNQYVPEISFWIESTVFRVVLFTFLYFTGPFVIIGLLLFGIYYTHKMIFALSSTLPIMCIGYVIPMLFVGAIFAFPIWGLWWYLSSAFFYPMVFVGNSLYLWKFNK